MENEKKREWQRGETLCDLAPEHRHEYQMVGVNTDPSSYPIIWAVCKYCLKKERVM